MSLKDHPEQYTFRCPACGSEFFRTEGGTERGIGICKGRWTGMGLNYTGCSFRWPREDDEKVFVRIDGGST